MISFKWRQFKKDIILMLVRWYLAYSLSYRDIEELAAERGLHVDYSTIHRWVVHYSPLLEKEFRKKHKRPVNVSWRMDETYLKLKSKDVYLYRAVDKFGDTIDLKLSEKRDRKAAFSFFQKCITQHGLPEKMTMDKSGANKAGVDEVNIQLALMFMLGGLFLQIHVRQIKYLNNILEQDHRAVKRITKPMMGFKSFDSAEATIAGIELHRMLRKGQHQHAANMAVHEQFYLLAA
ncbi:MAG: IS6 family transposase [Legionellales bacterium]|nr:IS6 family transposase [Legionellales bacterium]